MIVRAALLTSAVSLCCCKSKDPSPLAVTLTLKRTEFQLKTEVTVADVKGGILAVGAKDGRVLVGKRARRAGAPEELFDPNSDEPAHDGPLRVVQLSRTGDRLLSIGGHIAAFWDTGTRRLLRKVRGPDPITAGALRPEQDFVVFGTSRGHVLRWMPPSSSAKPVPPAACGGTRVAPARMRLPRKQRCPYGAYVEPDDQPPACLYPVTHLTFAFNSSLVRVCRTGEALIINLKTFSKTYFSPGHLRSLIPVGPDLALGREDGPLRLYGGAQRRVVREFNPKGEPASRLASAGDLVVAAQGRVLRIWHREHRDAAGPPVTLPAEPAWLALERPLLWVLLVDGRMLSYSVTVRPR